MTLLDIINNLTNILKEQKEELQNTHPLQWLKTEIKIPICKITYSYITVRDNDKKHTKYIIADENSWDLVENIFNQWIDKISS